MEELYGAPLLGSPSGRQEAMREEVEATFGHAWGGPHPEDDERYWGVSQALRQYMRRVHAPLLACPAVKAGVLAAFGALFLLSCAALPRLDK